MIFYKNCALITFILLKTIIIIEVQGKSYGDLSSNAIESVGKEKHVFGNQSAKSYFKENEVLEALPPALTDSIIPKDSNRNSLIVSVISQPTKIPALTPAKSYRNSAAKSKPTEVSKMTKDTYQETNTKETLKLMLPNGRAFPMEKISCRQITKTELNSQGEVIKSIQHICSPLSLAVVAATPLALTYTTTENILGTWTTSTPRGINCRRVMNSELNELGEIIDTVTEVCDPLPSSTTTSTRKPIVNTTPKVTTTTTKPLVKVCKPVMDSYLNEEGQIIDSVHIYCKMEPAT